MKIWPDNMTQDKWDEYPPKAQLLLLSEATAEDNLERFCDWEMLYESPALNSYEWCLIIRHRSDLLKHVNWDMITQRHWELLLEDNSNFKDNIYYKGWKLKNR